jgi:Uma2 family endonuclease
MATKRVPRIEDPDEIPDLEIPPGISGYEFVDGELVPVMGATFIHGRLIVKVAVLLEAHVQENRLPGKVLSDSGIVLGLIQDRKRMRAPDVCYISNERLEGTDPERLLRVIPEFAIEIDLTSRKKPHGIQRIHDYLAAGISLVWSIDPHKKTADAWWPDGRIEHYSEDDVLDAGEVVPGFRLAMRDLFPREA